MARRMLIVSTLLLGLAACRDNPTQPAGPPDSDPAVSSQALRAVGDLLEDPMVWVLLKGIEDEGTAQQLHSLFQQSSRSARRDDQNTTQAALKAAQDRAEEVVDSLDAVPLAVLRLVLDQAQWLLDDAAIPR